MLNMMRSGEGQRTIRPATLSQSTRNIFVGFDVCVRCSVVLVCVCVCARESKFRFAKIRPEFIVFDEITLFCSDIGMSNLHATS